MLTCVLPCLALPCLALAFQLLAINALIKQDLANAAWAFAKACHVDAAFFSTLARAAESKLSAFNEQARHALTPCLSPSRDMLISTHPMSLTI